MRGLMTPEDLKADLSERLGQRVSELFTREGNPVVEMTDPTNHPPQDLVVSCG